MKKILVVDDILYVLKSISNILQDEGYFVLTAMSGAEAITKFSRFEPDLMTIDQMLPDMTGLQLVEKLRKSEKGSKARIIFISAVDNKEEINAILCQDIDDYLLKPFKKAKLLETIRKLMPGP